MRRLIAFFLLLGGLALAGVAAFIYLHENPDPVPTAAAIVVLSGPGAETDLFGESLERVDAGLALLDVGAAPLLVMSGGGEPEDTEPPDAELMADYARSNGIADTQVLLEPRSKSTLQNALFTAALDQIDPDAPVIVVTHRYHLPRAWASFRWAGFTDITLVAPDRGAPAITTALLMEAVKWPVNVIRAAGASAALALGVEDDKVTPWLN